MEKDQADSIADTYHERVLRNEGELEGLKQLVAETRESDRKLIEQRSESLARELERRAEGLADLAKSNRKADNREHRDAMTAHIEHVDDLIALFREMYDERIQTNYEQSRESISALEERSRARDNRTDQAIGLIHSAEREARELQAGEYERRLTELNHAHEKQMEYQAATVTRELWEAAEAAMDTKIEGTKSSIELKIDTVKADLRKVEQYQENSSGRARGYTALVGWAFAGLTVVILVANYLTGGK